MKERAFSIVSGLALIFVSVLLAGRMVPIFFTGLDKIILYEFAFQVTFENYLLIGYLLLLHLLCMATLFGVVCIAKKVKPREEIGVLAAGFASFIAGIPCLLFCVTVAPVFFVQSFTWSQYIKYGILSSYVVYPLLVAMIFLVGLVGEFTQVFNKIKSASV